MEYTNHEYINIDLSEFLILLGYKGESLDVPQRDRTIRQAIPIDCALRWLRNKLDLHINIYPFEGHWSYHVVSIHGTTNIHPDLGSVCVSYEEAANMGVALILEKALQKLKKKKEEMTDGNQEP